MIGLVFLAYDIRTDSQGRLRPRMKRLAATWVTLAVTISSVWGLSGSTVLAQEAPGINELDLRHRQLLGTEQYILQESERLQKEQEEERQRRARDYPDFDLEQALEEDAPESLKIAWMGIVSRDNAFQEEISTKFGWLQVVNRELSEKIEKAKTANPAFARVLEKEIRHDIELAERLAAIFTGPPADTPSQSVTVPHDDPRPRGTAAGDLQGAPDGNTAAPRESGTDLRGGRASNGQPGTEASGTASDVSTRPTLAGMDSQQGDDGLPPGKRLQLKKMTGFASGILYQMNLHDEVLSFAAQESNVQAIQQKAVESYGEGMAGAGGISLHTAATMPKAVDGRSVRKAGVENGRLVLSFKDGRQAVFPAMPLDDLAAAICAIYGKEGIVSGELKAIDGDAVVLRTGRDAFGDVVWRKSFLAEPFESVPIGTQVSLPLGPALGILSLPQPSRQRITYFGPIRDTRIGDVLARADYLLHSFLMGVDLSTGRPAPVPPISGYMTILEANARIERGEHKPRSRPDPPRTDKGTPGWWTASTWFVWGADRIEMRSVNSGKSYEFGQTRMKLTAWSSGPKGVPPVMKDLVSFVNRNYRTLANTFPVLNELEDVGKTVAVVRWLKRNRIPVNLTWARSHRARNVPTEDVIPAYLVYVMRDGRGKPVFGRPAEEGLAK